MEDFYTENVWALLMEQQPCNANHQGAGPLKFSYFIALWATIDSETPAGLGRETEQKDKLRHNPAIWEFWIQNSLPSLQHFYHKVLSPAEHAKMDLFPCLVCLLLQKHAVTWLFGSWLSVHLFQIVQLHWKQRFFPPHTLSCHHYISVFWAVSFLYTN